MSFKTVGIIVFLSLFNGFFSVEDEDRIINGSNVSIQSYPYQGSIKYNNFHTCGCSLYNNQIAITAAHCMEDYTRDDLKYLTVDFGSSLLNSGYTRRQIKSFAIHQSYNRSNFNFDIALIRFQSPIQFTNVIQPITLATQVPSNGTKAYVTGWGVLENDNNNTSAILQGAAVDYVRKEDCSIPTFKYPKSLITSSMACAISLQSAPCRGDSGGPLIDVKTRQQIGIVSWGSICGSPGYPAVYTSIPVFNKWISTSAGIMTRT